MKSICTVFCSIIALVAFAIWAPYVKGFEGYNDPNQNNGGHCSSTLCHPGFTGDHDVTHELHTGGDIPITTNCDLCHTSSEDDDTTLTLWSAYNNDKGYGCTGCHGRYYDETIGRDYKDFPISGKPKASGWGLRRVHELKGVTSCFNCHGDMDPLPENVSPPYYVDSSAGVNLTDPCSDGLDNDGDGLYDNVDSDCGENSEIAHSDNVDGKGDHRLLTQTIVKGT